MRYFTKDWYNDTILAEMCFQIKSSHKAEKPNEKYFASLYAAQKKWFVKNEKRTAKYSGATFDKTSSENKFDENFNENLKYVKEKLPQDIIANVADVRLLAIGVASYDVLQAIVRYCGQINRRCETIKNNYENESDKLADSVGWYKINTLELIANAPIVSAEQTADSFIITTSAENTGVACKVTLKNAKAEYSDNLLIGSSPLFIELLPAETDGKLELNLLCRTEDGKSVEFSATADDVDTEEITDSV